MLKQFWRENGQSAARDTRATTGNSPQCAEKSAPASVLVVDDEPLIRWSVAETLGGHGYDVSEADDARSAIDMFNRRAADVVLLDLRLPDCDDLRVLSVFQRLSPHTPVIVMTAFGTPELFLEARRLGAFATLDKPFEMDVIGPIVGRALVSRLH